MTPNEALIEFRSWLKVRHYRPATQASYTNTLNTFWAWLSQESITDLRLITRAKLDGYAAQIRTQSVNRWTQALRLRAVKRLFGFLVETNHLLIDPAVGLRDPSSGWRLPRPVLNPLEIKRLLAQPGCWPSPTPVYHTGFGIGHF